MIALPWSACPSEPCSSMLCHALTSPVGSALGRLRCVPALSVKPCETRMHARSQSLLIGHSTKERGQHISLVCRQRDQQRVLVIARQPANGLERFASFVGQMQGIASPIRWVSPSLHHAAFLELVNQDHQPARQDPQVARQSLLANPAGRTHKPQNGRVGRREVEGAQPLCEPRGGMRPELSQKECGRVSTARWRRFVRGARCGGAHVDKDNITD